MRDATISVVVPTLNEEARVEGALRSARRAFGDEAEVLVVDGGSVDSTPARAEPLARVLVTEPGRGRQLDAGARAARGELLVFLHADTRLPSDAAPALRELLDDPWTAGGCFRFALDPPPRGFDRWRLLELAIRLRTRLLRTATGDQVLFCTRAAYRRCGGFPHWPLFEDVAFVRRLRRVGRFRVLPWTAATSRRRWRRAGFWRTVATHWMLRLTFWLGISPGRLARWYRRLTPSGPGSRKPGGRPLSRRSRG